MPNFILSTVGTSVLTNLVSTDERNQGWAKRLTNNANCSPAELAPDAKIELEELERRARARLHEGETPVIRRVSAELNGIYGIYGNQLQRGAGDMHWLVATDTAQGQLAASIVQDHLREKGLTVSIFCPPKLCTADTRHFAEGVKALITWCEENIPAFRASGYKVCFNLVASFKSLQGYLNTIGMFYADEIVYIFESATADLIRIPRLPITIDMQQLSSRVVELAMMSAGHLYPAAQARDWGLPESLLNDDDRHVTLSTWGQLIWNRSRRDLLRDDLLPFPHLEYSAAFRQEFKQAALDERVQLQDTLGEVAAILDQSHGSTVPLKAHPSLQYDNYTGKATRDGHPIGHFRLDGARRVTCLAVNDHLVLRHFGAHQVTENNP